MLGPIYLQPKYRPRVQESVVTSVKSPDSTCILSSGLITSLLLLGVADSLLIVQYWLRVPVRALSTQVVANTVQSTQQSPSSLSV